MERPAWQALLTDVVHHTTPCRPTAKPRFLCTGKATTAHEKGPSVAGRDATAPEGPCARDVMPESNRPTARLLAFVIGLLGVDAPHVLLGRLAGFDVADRLHGRSHRM